MDAWFQRGRPALFETLTNVCKQIDQELLAELRQGQTRGDEDKTREGPLPTVEAQKASSAGQTDGSASILTPSATDETLAARSSAERSSHRQDDDPARQLPSKDGNQWKAAYFSIHTKHEKLKENYKLVKASLERRTTQRKAFADEVEELKRKLAEAQASRSTATSGENVRPRPISDADVPQPAVIPPSRSSTDPVKQLPSDEVIETAAARGVSASGRATASDNTTESTQGESGGDPREDLPPIAAAVSKDTAQDQDEPASSSPIVVLSRQVRKRKRSSEEAESGRAKVKMERANSSSPLIAIQRPMLVPVESIDLGDVSQRMMTPRKHKGTGKIELFNPREPLQTTTWVPVETPRLFQVHRDAVSESHIMARNDHREPLALTPMSTNARLAEPAQKQARTQRTRNDLSRGIGQLAEDGALYGKAASDRDDDKKTTVKGTLDALLNAPVRDEDAPITAKRANATPLAMSPAATLGLSLPGRRALPFDANAEPGPRTPYKSAQTPNVGRSTSKVKRTPLQQLKQSKVSGAKGPETPLRHTPVAKLRLEDFRVNPLANEGHDYAFTEVVRDKNARADLPGCTDMHCCGKEFRALALSQRPDPPLTPAQRQQEHDLLERYLGDECHRLAYMMTEEKAELWVEAKMHELANKFGKHRHRYSRMRSPPGFWNADFPSTQELETDRAEAAERERAAVDERHREAMRPGGRWKFRDE